MIDMEVDVIHSFSSQPDVANESSVELMSPILIFL